MTECFFNNRITVPVLTRSNHRMMHVVATNSGMLSHHTIWYSDKMDGRDGDGDRKIVWG